MSFLTQLATVADTVDQHVMALQQKPRACTTTTPAYRQTLGMILERIDRLAYVFVVAPFCYDTERMYEQINLVLCGILKLIKRQNVGSLSPAEGDFLTALDEQLTQLCVQLLCTEGFLQIEEQQSAAPAPSMTASPE